MHKHTQLFKSASTACSHCMPLYATVCATVCVPLCMPLCVPLCVCHCMPLYATVCLACSHLGVRAKADGVWRKAVDLEL